MEDINKIKDTYKSKEYYRKITEIKYTPCIENEHVYLAHPKGEVKEVKLFGLTLYRKVYREDVYHRANSAIDLEEDDFYKSFAKNNRIYSKARVYITSGGNEEEYLFDDDEKAKKFVVSIIEECRLCGNDLA